MMMLIKDDNCVFLSFIFGMIEVVNHPTIYYYSFKNVWYLFENFNCQLERNLVYRVPIPKLLEATRNFFHTSQPAFNFNNLLQQHIVAFIQCNKKQSERICKFKSLTIVIWNVVATVVPTTGSFSTSVFCLMLILISLFIHSHHITHSYQDSHVNILHSYFFGQNSNPLKPL